MVLISLKWWPTHLIASLPVTILGSTLGRGLQRVALKWYPILRRCLKVSFIFLPACPLPHVSLSSGIWNSEHLDWIKNRIRAMSSSASSLMQQGCWTPPIWLGFGSVCNLKGNSTIGFFPDTFSWGKILHVCWNNMKWNGSHPYFKKGEKKLK